MSIRSKLVFSLSIILAFNLAVGFYAFQAYGQAANSAEQVSRWADQIMTTSLSAQLHFKKQVQEWKNVLLRGHEPELYERYLNQFYAEERNTRNALETLLLLLDEDSEIRNTTQAFYQAHRELGSQYREALSYYHQVSNNPMWSKNSSLNTLAYSVPFWVRLTRGFGTRTASFAMKSSGSKITCGVPSR